MKKWLLKTLSLSLILVMVLAGCSAPADTVNADEVAESSSQGEATETDEPETGTDEIVRLQDDFYAAVNKEWMDSTDLPADKVSVGGFEDISGEVEKLLMEDFRKMLDGELEADPILTEFLKYYAMASDYDTRNAQGAEPLQPYLEQVEAINSMADMNEVLADWILSGMPVPMSLYVMSDMNDAQVYAMYAGAPSLFLPDVSYYEEGNEVGPQILGLLQGTMEQLLILSGYSEAEAGEIAENALAFDNLLVPYIKTAEESSDFTLLYNPHTLEDFSAYSGIIDLSAVATSLIGTAPGQIIVTDPQFYEVFDQVYNEENFPLFKDWLLASTVFSMSSFLSMDFIETAAAYSMAMTGQAEMDDPQKTAYYLASGTYNMVVGDYYGRRYFGDEAKNDVIGMVDSMIDIFQSRLEENDWLSDETIEAAIRKLEYMSVNIGYPDAVDPLYEQMTVKGLEEGGNFLSNIMDFSRLMMEDNFGKYGTEVDKGEWPISANTVNAMYSPLTNTITFPAAILQAPFYNLEQSPSQNYGGIGAVIAHEITHAFDPNGAQFDEYGNYKSWWTEEDYTAFEERTVAMVEQFDGLEYAGSAVNGRLTVTENIADAGGLSCALEVVKSLPDANLEEFFTNWAVIWRMQATPEYEQLLMTIDVHAPNKLRANVQPQNLDDFYTTFSIAEGDGMYMAPENRVSIW